ncbi:hypothetical protein BC628DRAFT_165232 [Trametes gibbosa]|nr:hypothetical protein BC628DRAFT_165232 [Trametes gibbosa]
MRTCPSLESPLLNLASRTCPSHRSRCLARTHDLDLIFVMSSSPRSFSAQRNGVYDRLLSLMARCMAMHRALWPSHRKSSSRRDHGNTATARAIDVSGPAASFCRERPSLPVRFSSAFPPRPSPALSPLPAANSVRPMTSLRYPACALSAVILYSTNIRLAGGWVAKPFIRPQARTACTPYRGLSVSSGSNRRDRCDSSPEPCSARPQGLASRQAQCTI